MNQIEIKTTYRVNKKEAFPFVVLRCVSYLINNLCFYFQLHKIIKHENIFYDYIVLITIPLFKE